jgi:hypothetical protein
MTKIKNASNVSNGHNCHIVAMVTMVSMVAIVTGNQATGKEQQEMGARHRVEGVGCVKS